MEIYTFLEINISCKKMIKGRNFNKASLPVHTVYSNIPIIRTVGRASSSSVHKMYCPTGIRIGIYIKHFRVGMAQEIPRPSILGPFFTPRFPEE